MRRLPPLNWLKAFESTARLLSFTAAAKELGMTQSAISQQIRLLESHLGEALFYRRGRGISMTEAANRFFPVVHESFDRIERGSRFFSPNQEPFSISVSSNISFWVYWLLPRTSEFLALHPASNLRFSTTRWSTDPRPSGASMEILYGDGDWSLPSERLTKTVMFPVCSPALAQRIRQPSDLAQLDRIINFGEEALWEEWGEGARVNVSEMRQRYTVDLQLAAIDLACRGMGVAFTNGVLALDLLQSNKLCVPVPFSISARDNYYLSLRDVANLGLEIADFARWLKALLSEHQAALVGQYFSNGRD